MISNFTNGSYCRTAGMFLVIALSVYLVLCPREELFIHYVQSDNKVQTHCVESRQSKGLGKYTKFNIILLRYTYFLYKNCVMVAWALDLLGSVCEN